MRDEENLDSFKFSEFEIQKNRELQALMDEWKKQLSKNTTPINNGDCNKTTPDDCFAQDVFFPGYYKQKKKICFIGRETRKIGGHDFRLTTEDRLFFYELEEKKNQELDLLFDDWINQLEKNETPIHNGKNKKTTPSDCFAKDGFFPGYFNQEKKVCFIGRETRSIGGKDFRETTMEDYFNRFENKNNWWRHILYIVYGIRNEGKLSYENIPPADKILAEMKKEEKYGFAVINISKYSNDDKTSWVTNRNLVHRFLEDSDLEKTNFFERELQILDPDVIITANLWDGTIDTRVIIKSCGLAKIV